MKILKSENHSQTDANNRYFRFFTQSVLFFSLYLGRNRVFSVTKIDFYRVLSQFCKFAYLFGRFQHNVQADASILISTPFRFDILLQFILKIQRTRYDICALSFECIEFSNKSSPTTCYTDTSNGSMRLTQ